MKEETILIPEIDRQVLRKYLFWLLFWVSIIMWLTIFGIIWTVVWIFGFGVYYCHRRSNEVYYELTNRKLIVKDGVYVKKEHSIPLDKITDLKSSQGILERSYGIWRINVQTAGAGTPVAEATLFALKDPHEFKRIVLETRDGISQPTQQFRQPEVATVAVQEGSSLVNSSLTSLSTQELLKEIRDILVNIELNTSR